MKILFLTLLAFPGLLLAQSGLPDNPYIYVEGRAEVEKPADMVTLRFDLVARNSDQAKANQEVQTKAAKILALADERKIAKADVIASDLRSEPQYEQEPSRPNEPGKVVGYVITRPFSVKVRDLTVFPRLVDDLIAFGGVQFSGIEAGLTTERELQDQIWEKALANARERAEKTLKAMGMKISSVFAVSPVNFPEIGPRIFGSSQPTARYAAAAAPELNPGQYRLPSITLNQSVHVIYLIAPAP
jgi:uncharacterized protein YggE